MTQVTNPTTITAQPGLPFIDIVREFDAPLEAVFRAHVDPELFVQWNGPRSITTNIVEWDPRAGGRWHYVADAGQGHTFGFNGVFHKVEPNRLIVQTFEFSGAPDQAGIGTMRLEEIEGRTRLSSHEVYPTVDSRDAALASGMEWGIREGYERLDEVLAR